MMASPEDLSQVAVSVMHAVKGQPGIHFRGLARAADITSMGQLRHHVDRLQRRGLILELEDGRFKRYFASGDHPADLRRVMARFGRPVPRRIGKLLLWRPMGRAELRRNLGCADSTLGYHLSRMQRQGDVVKTGSGNRSRYALSDPATMRRALMAQEAQSPIDARAVDPSATGRDGPHRPHTHTNEAPVPAFSQAVSVNGAARSSRNQTERPRIGTIDAVDTPHAAASKGPE